MSGVGLSNFLVEQEIPYFNFSERNKNALVRKKKKKIGNYFFHHAQTQYH